MKLLRFAAAAAFVFAVSGPASAQQSTLDKVKNAGVLKVCLAQGSPDQYKDPKTGEWVGVMVDLLKELSTWMKVKLEPVEVQWNVAVLALKRGDCDLFGGSLIYNAPRAMEINYIRPFWAKGMNAVIRKDNPKGLKDPDGLNSDKVTLAAIVGSREHETARRLFPNAKILALQANADVQIIESVRRGDADAALLPTITIKWWLQVAENSAWAAMGFEGKDFGNAPNGWAIRYGDPDWKDFLDAFSGWVAANNVAVALYDDYLKRTNPFQK
jgi:ABC-type amino acid transport substrate-binding protein